MSQADGERAAPNFPTQVGGQGGGSLRETYEKPCDGQLIRQALRRKWVSDERAESVLRVMEKIALESTSTRAQVNAARVIMQAAGIDARRESTETQAHTADVNAGLSALREALKSPDSRKSLQAAAGHACNDPLTVEALPAPTPPASQEAKAASQEAKAASQDTKPT